MSRVCKTVCVECGQSFDQYSGRLLNLSESFLPIFYELEPIKKALATGKQHPTLCASCLEKALGRSIKFSEIKFKNGKWMTSNVVYLLNKLNISLEERLNRLHKIESLNVKGCLPYTHGKDDKRLFAEFLRTDNQIV